MLNAEEEKHEVPMEMEEHGAGYDREEALKIPCRSKTNGQVPFTQNFEEFSKENKLTFNINFNSSSNSRTSNNFGNPDLRSLPEHTQIESKSLSNHKKHFIINPSLCDKLTVSEITGGHGVVKRARVCRLESGKVSWSQGWWHIS